MVEEGRIGWGEAAAAETEAEEWVLEGVWVGGRAAVDGVRERDREEGADTMPLVLDGAACATVSWRTLNSRCNCPEQTQGRMNDLI